MTDVPLDEYERDVDPLPGEADDRERFTVDNDRKATWAVRKLTMYQQRIVQAQQIADDEMARIQEWLDRQLNRDANDIAYFEALLTRYALAQRSDHDRKSVDTPYGIVKTRVGQPKYTVFDAEAFFAWARSSRPDFIRVKEDVDLAALKGASTLENTPTLGLVAVTDDGEIVPGVQVAPAQITVKVEAAS